MAGTLGRSTRDLNAEIAEEASGYEFFQAVRLLSLASRQAGEERCRGELPAGLRFRTPVSLTFPPSEVVRYVPGTRSETDLEPAQDEMTVSFMGLTGPSGVLPTAYTELLIERRQLYGDTGAHAFFDLFSHRAVALFHAAWRKYRYWLAVEAGEQDGFSRHLLDLSGLGLSRLRGGLATGETAGIDERLFIRHAGILAQKPVSAQAIIALIEAFAGVPAQLEQFVGQWMELPAEEQTQLGCGACELGRSAFVGARAWDRQGKVRLRLGPMQRRDFDRFLPGQPGAEGVRALVKFAVGFRLACDVTLVLDRGGVPEPRLCADAPLRLGGNAWLVSEKSDRDRDEMSYRVLQ